MSIITQTKNVMAKAIMRYADENEIEPTQSQVLIYTEDAECLPAFKVCKDHKPIKKVSFNELLNVKLDFLGREQLATPFIKNCIKRLTKENSCSYSDVNVLVYSKDQKCEDIKLHLFIKTVPTKELSFDYIFGEDDN